MDPNELYVRNYAPFNIFRELENNYLSLDVVDMKFQGELKYKPISKVELAVLGAYKYSTTTNAATITDQSNQPWVCITHRSIIHGCIPIQTRQTLCHSLYWKRVVFIVRPNIR
jgi:hypothetical protein